MPESNETQSDAFETAREGALSWLSANWDPKLTVREWWARLADSGWGFPAWPVEWFGKGMSADEAAGVRAAFAESRALPPPASLGQMLGAPMLLLHGSEEQKQRFLPPLARGEEYWCQFFSEPGSGSDLASAQTRAVRDGDVWHVDGQKVWTSGAQYADRGMLLARTNREVPKHQGLSFFILDLDQPGVDVRPLHQMNGAHGFNEVFFSDAEVDSDRLITEENAGWGVAVTVLMYERFMSSMPSAPPGAKQGMLDRPAGSIELAGSEEGSSRSPSEVVIEAARKAARNGDPVLRQRLAGLWGQENLDDLLVRSGQSVTAGRRPSGAGSLNKLSRSSLARTARETGLSTLGANGLLNSDGSSQHGDSEYGEIQFQSLSSPSFSIAGGTDEIQRGIVGERVLGLPKEPRTDRDIPFKDLTIGTQRSPG
ncbi:MAG TPA: acyl-CoA dehydrogenase family protein [Streptosporangiaceae bacterium]